MPRRARRQAGFTFIEVIIALGILVVGSVSVLALFAIGVNHQIQRRIDARLEQVRPEIRGVIQSAVDQAAPGGVPEAIQAHKLSRPGYALRVSWGADPFGGTTVVAHAKLVYRGEVVRVIPPIPVQRATLDPRRLGGGSDGDN